MLERSLMDKRIRVTLNIPVLLLSYDWERYGKWDDPEKNKQDQTDSINGINAILKAHLDLNAPFTLFVLGKLLEVPKLGAIAEEITKKYCRDFVDFQQHTYSHIMIKTNVLRGEGASVENVKEDLLIGKRMIEELTGRESIGLGSAQSFYRGLLDEPERQKIIYDTGIRFIRSDGRGFGDTRPAPSHDDSGNYRCPYFYAKTPELLEIPAHGFSDNYLKGFSKEMPGQNWSIGWEIEEHLKFFKEAIENRSHFAPMMHEWSLARKDLQAEVVRALIGYAQDKGVEILTFNELYNRIIQTSK